MLHGGFWIKHVGGAEGKTKNRRGDTIGGETGMEHTCVGACNRMNCGGSSSDGSRRALSTSQDGNPVGRVFCAFHFAHDVAKPKSAAASSRLGSCPSS